MTKLLSKLTVMFLALSLSACAGLSMKEKQQIAVIAHDARDTALTCAEDDPMRCAIQSPLHELAGSAYAKSTGENPHNYALILDAGSDALVARLNLIRSATRTVDLQTYIYDEDDSGRLVLDELVKAAQRGVRVRVLMDQLSAMKKVDTLAALSGVHRNFSVKIFNPVLNRARMSYPQYAVAAACCWSQLNRRMHTKLLLVDSAVGITGGRNYQDDYYDWDDDYNFRDRDVLVTGPTTRVMAADFDRFWFNPLSVQPQLLKDVGKRILRDGVPKLEPHPYASKERTDQILRAAEDQDFIRETLVSGAMPVGNIQYVSDSPDKAQVTPGPAGDHQLASDTLQAILRDAKTEVLLQTPYLVMSKNAQALFRELQDRPEPPRIFVSTNSLAATDAFIAYAIAYKYKRRYIRRLGFEIYEYKPFPADIPGVTRTREDDDRVGLLVRANDRARGVVMRESGARRYLVPGANKPVRLQREGVRYGLHAKSMVVDERVAVIGTHNFDPRGSTYNTESILVIRDPAFAAALARSIRSDMDPGNSWVIAPRKLPVFSGLSYSLGKISNELPIFDFWPVSYATSYQYIPSDECPRPLTVKDPDFFKCYQSVGDFPEARFGFKPLMTRFFVAFGSGLAPIM